MFPYATSEQSFQADGNTVLQTKENKKVLWSVKARITSSSTQLQNF